MVDIYSKKKRSWIMSRIRGKDTGIERTMADALKRARLEFEAHPNDIPGRPDFVLRANRVAVFCDSEFWHGYRMGPKSLTKLSTFWQNKIVSNKRRDRRVNALLRAQGWHVCRFWGREITTRPDECASRVARSPPSATGG